MGIYDREYYRKDGPRYLDALIPSGRVCKFLILINVGAYIIQLATQPAQMVFPGLDEVIRQQNQFNFTNLFSLDTAAVMQGQVWRLLTGAFLHDPTAWQHIVFNMLFLWWFGSDLENMYGPREFLAFYLTSAILSSVAYVIWAVARQQPSVAIGASGAVTAVMVLFAWHFPRHTVYVFFVLPAPIWLFVLFQVAQDTFIFVGNRPTNIGVVAHLAGAVFGTVYYKSRLRLTGWLPTWGEWKRRRSQPRLKLFRPEDEKEAVTVAAPSSDLDEHLEAKLDAVLEKVARTGKDSLTDSERQILMRASEIYKKRRS